MMLALDNQHIYFVAGSYIGLGNVEDGKNVEPRFNARQHVYWADATAGAIKRANLVGTGVDSSLITGAVNPMGVTVDFEHVYWANTFNCNYHTQPPSACGGGTLGRANLDGSDVNQTYVTADTRTGPGLQYGAADTLAARSVLP